MTGPVHPVLALARSRDVPRAAAGSLLVALAATVFTGTRVDVPDFRYLVDFSVPVAAVAPVAYAVVLGTTLYSPMADLEHTAAQPVEAYRRAQLVALTLFAVALSALPMAAGLPFEVFAASARNAAGYLGLAVISARLFGSGLAWLLPLGTFGPTLLLGVGEDNTPEWWAWSIERAATSSALVIAAVLWLTALVLPGAPPRADDRAET
ncbi:hypothetical protein [Streptomyces roseolilacinus]|uniref:Uncharacterized protein n=1 Tax=Streptomyces roseolilacinus TaxID=66904 RepID=A0A918B1D6_9ACTN|nr:hypothetical protein [Streptomyces roseolilacinus]GGQ13840.1 hypothetical protein GCM10010249_35870 [Streptomyces roseolilacinus]